jgi:hypothetical protein
MLDDKTREQEEGEGGIAMMRAVQTKTHHMNKISNGMLSFLVQNLLIPMLFCVRFSL